MNCNNVTPAMRVKIVLVFFIIAAILIGFFGNIPLLGISPVLKSAPQKAAPTVSGPAKSGRIFDLPKAAGSSRQEKLVALTFDDGPTSPYTEQVLTILKSRKIKATFFVTGANVDASPYLLRKIVEDGHEIGNHTYSHPHLLLTSVRRTKQEILRTEEAIKRAGCEKPKWFRPPYGQKDLLILKEADKLGYKVVSWSVASYDWRHPGVHRIVKNVIKRVKNGAIVLLHDGREDRSQTVMALPMILDELEKNGFKCVTLSELFRSKNPPTVRSDKGAKLPALMHFFSTLFLDLSELL